MGTNGDIDWQQASPSQACFLLRALFRFDFVALGMTDDESAPLRWKYASGASNDRYRYIALSWGHGIGGIVISAGQPLIVTDIENQLDPREYSGFPIVFAEGLRSFCAYPLKAGPVVKGVLLGAFRHVDIERHKQIYAALGRLLSGGLCGYTVQASFARDTQDTSEPRRSAAGSPDVFYAEDANRILLETNPYKVLSDRELDVFALIARGYTNREIAKHLNISVKTVEARRKKVFSKLGITTRAELVSYAIAFQFLSK